MNAAILGIAIISSVVYVASGSILLWRKGWSGSGLMALTSVSAGLLLAIAILDLIPDSSEEMSGSSLYIMLGFLFMYLIHLLSSALAHRIGPKTSGPDAARGDGTAIGVTIGMMLHNLVEGAAIGFSYESGITLGVMVSLALIVHKIPEGLSYSSVMLGITGRRRATAWLLVAQGLCVWLGLAGSVVFGGSEASEQWSAGALALIAGLFLYVGATALLPAILRQQGRWLPVLFIGGILLYYVMHGTAEALG